MTTAFWISAALPVLVALVFVAWPLLRQPRLRRWRMSPNCDANCVSSRASSRIAMLRFPSFEAAKAFYDDELYKQARTQRAGATAFFNMVLVEGVAAPVF